MVFQHLSSFAWLAVIAIQAFIHFVVGPRYSGIESNEKHHPDSSSCSGSGSVSSTEAAESSMAMKNANVRTHSYSTLDMSMSSSTDLDDCDMSADGMDHSMPPSNRTVYTSAIDASIDPDERDSIDESVGVRGMQNAKHTEFHRTSHGSDSDLYGRDETVEEMEIREVTRSRSNPEMQPCQHDQEICDDCIDDDEEWRYNLIKDYYSTSYYHMMSRSASSLEDANEEEDPALLPVGTINTLSEKLDQQRRLTKLNLSSQRNSRSVSFDHSPVSIIASY